MMDISLIIRYLVAIAIAFGLSYHGLSKKSLNMSGSLAAVFVGFASFACSYRFGLILILFYYSSSKFTKWKQEYKASIEEDYAVGGQRNWIQVLASSFLATLVAIIFYFTCGEDQNISFGVPNDTDNILELYDYQINTTRLATYLWILYIAHYCTANADTWASELGVLSSREPRLVTSFFLRSVPKGTNGGMSLFGTAASGAGGLFIGIIYWIFSFLPSIISNTRDQYNQWPILIFTLLCGLLGSLIDSILGATVQATYYSKEKKCIVKIHHSNELKDHKDKSIKCICGINILSNEAVNFVSILLTMILSLWLAPNVYCWLDTTQCFEANYINTLLWQKIVSY